MDYESVWKKVLRNDEKVEYEFSIGKKYRMFGLIMFSIFLLPMLFASVVFTVLVWLIVFFYFGFYLKVANAYAFTDKRVLIHVGWLSTHTTSIEYSKITDLSVQEPFLERLITKTGSLAINTAGTNYKEVVLRHITAPYEVRKKLDVIRT